MTWNWQHPDWPEFLYKSEDFEKYETEFLQKSGILLGSVKHIPSDDQEILKIDLITDEAYKTSEIEGELLNRASLQSSIRKQFGLQTDLRKIPAAEQGVAEMMVDIYRHYASPLSETSICAWHHMLMNGRRDLRNVGVYRTHPEPMQIVSGSYDRPIVHFEAPPSMAVPYEMNRFIDWFNSTAPGEKKALPGLVRSGIAHLYFESIHPFEDGNGRIGRAISEMALSQRLKRPALIAISTAIEAHKKTYYESLNAGSRSLDISGWLQYFCTMVLDAQDRTQRSVDFIIQKGLFYTRFSGLLNERQAKVVARMLREGISGFKGGLSAENYIRITNTSRATATRDLQNLVELGAFMRTGERKHTRYALNIASDTANWS
jgi:Fic family protein